MSSSENVVLNTLIKSIFSLAPAEYVVDYFDDTDKLFYLSHGVDTDYYTPTKAFYSVKNEQIDGKIVSFHSYFALYSSSTVGMTIQACAMANTRSGVNTRAANASASMMPTIQITVCFCD